MSHKKTICLKCQSLFNGKKKKKKKKKRNKLQKCRRLKILPRVLIVYATPEEYLDISSVFAQNIRTP